MWVGLWRKLRAEELMLLNCGVGEDSWESLGSNQSILKEISSGWPMEGIMLKLKCRYLATWCEHLTHWKRPWCWGRLRAGGEVDNRGWNGWMESWTRWTWVWVDSRGWWWTEKPGVLRFMGSQRVRHDWATKLNWIVSSYSVAIFVDVCIANNLQKYNEILQSTMQAHSLTFWNSPTP